MPKKPRPGREPSELQQGTVSSLWDNHGFIVLKNGEEALFHRRGVGEPWGFEDIKVGDKVVCSVISVRIRGVLKARAYDVRVFDPRRKPGR